MRLYSQKIFNSHKRKSVSITEHSQDLSTWQRSIIFQPCLVKVAKRCTPHVTCGCHCERVIILVLFCVHKVLPLIVFLLSINFYADIIINFRAVGVLAKLLNKSADAETFYNRSKNYKNVWNKEKELLCPRSKSGKLHCPLDPTLNTWIIKESGFTEGEHKN